MSISVVIVGKNVYMCKPSVLVESIAVSVFVVILVEFGKYWDELVCHMYWGLSDIPNQDIFKPYLLFHTVTTFISISVVSFVCVRMGFGCIGVYLRKRGRTNKQSKFPALPRPPTHPRSLEGWDEEAYLRTKTDLTEVNAQTSPLIWFFYGPASLDLLFLARDRIVCNKIWQNWLRGSLLCTHQRYRVSPHTC